MIERCTSPDDPRWFALRSRLFPQCPDEDHVSEMAEQCADPGNFAAMLFVEKGDAVGLMEIALRHDYVNGTDSTPVAFLEGIYVAPECRRRGIATALIRAAEEWARERGCTELASDALLENATSHALHHAAGFQETERVVFFNKSLT